MLVKSSANLYENEKRPQTISKDYEKRNLQGSRVSGSKIFYDDRSENRSETNSQQSRISKLIMKEHEN